MTSNFASLLTRAEREREKKCSLGAICAHYRGVDFKVVRATTPTPPPQLRNLIALRLPLFPPTPYTHTQSLLLSTRAARPVYYIDRIRVSCVCACEFEHRTEESARIHICVYYYIKVTPRARQISRKRSAPARRAFLRPPLLILCYIIEARWSESNLGERR